MTVGRRDNPFADPRETERLIGRVLAGKMITMLLLIHYSNLKLDFHEQFLYISNKRISQKYYHIYSFIQMIFFPFPLSSIT